MEQKKRVQIMLSSEVDLLLRKLSKEERRTISAITELAILAYWSAKEGKGKGTG